MQTMLLSPTLRLLNRRPADQRFGALIPLSKASGVLYARLGVSSDASTCAASGRLKSSETLGLPIPGLR